MATSRNPQDVRKTRRFLKDAAQHVDHVRAVHFAGVRIELRHLARACGSRA